VHRQLCLTLLGVAMLTLSGAARAQCENLRVIVRNSVYPIQNLDAFCTEFNKMKADLANLRAGLSLADRENRLLRAQLADAQARLDADRLAGLDTVAAEFQAAPANRKSSQ
jgi:hypothetical protein